MSQAATITARVTALRAHMRSVGVAYVLVPSADAHQSEYVPTPWQRRSWISNFTGSMGDALVGLGNAWVFADSRYWLQGEAEVDGTPFQLVRVGAIGHSDLATFLGQLPDGARVGFDPMLHTIQETKRFRDILAGIGGELIALEINPIDAIRDDLPPRPETPVAHWPDAFSGRSIGAKLADLRGDLKRESASWLAVTTLDELAWTFNIRGRDVDFNPVTIAWALVGTDATMLFVDDAKVGPEVRAILTESGITLKAYDDFGATLDTLSGRIWLDPASANAWIESRLDRFGVSLLLKSSPVLGPRSRKNPTEMKGMRAAHVRDGVAVTRFLAWLEANWRDGVDELAAAERLAAFRAEGELFQGLSFDTIAGFAGNGAIVHYRSSPATTKTIDDSTLFLLDSGAQYLDGTTDITRTLHLGTPTDAQKEHYTRVLRGHLALGRAVFPQGTTGTHLDALARMPLWEVTLNYGHGTGHGVGCYLSVHQGPHRVAPGFNTIALEPGMVLSNEPGFYLADAYGIRIENLVLVVPHADSTPFGPFHRFEDLTLVPYCRALIAVELLESTEIRQVDAYHARVRETLLPHLEGAAREFLLKETTPLLG